MNSSLHTLEVNTGHCVYPIYIGASAWGNCPSQKNTTYSRLILVSSPNIWNFYETPVRQLCMTKGWDPLVYLLPDSERSKNIDEAMKLVDFMLSHSCDRASLLMAVGGGVVGDLTGFVASLYLRGIDFWQFPTTLLSQVDSSVGGKVAVNRALGKNTVGAFWQPKAVFADVSVLNTLPDNEFSAGLAEVVKYACIVNWDFAHYLKANREKILAKDSTVLTEVVARCCQMKADVVEQDETEKKGVRSYLNFGHTLGHALEVVTNYQLYLHGEAVALGMLVAGQMSVKRDWISSDDFNLLYSLCDSFSLPTQVRQQHSQKELIKALMGDKKNLHGQLRYVLLKRSGEAELCSDVSVEEILESLSIIGL